jgi:transcriptional regulator with GAF, ATPase, and Fis domain
MSGKLVILSGPLCGGSVSLSAQGLTIGRESGNQLIIPDQSLSRRHCAVEVDDEWVVLRDHGSANGTYVNGEAIRERVLRDGDRIRAGESILLFVATEPPQERQAMEVAEPLLDGTTHRIPLDDWVEASIASTPASAHGEMLEVSRQARHRLNMVGDSKAIHAVQECIRKVAASDCTVLVSGETGTGKELAARAIHENGARSRAPFVAINCAALTEPLLESELFGHEKGAFTGAIGLKKGRLELADSGTLFLDEIGDLAPGLQAKLLRALQHHEFERVGGTRTIKVNVRIIAATNADLQAAVVAGRFRQDLWYRLNVVRVIMPPLRARRSDIPQLASHFAGKYGGGRAIQFSPEALDRLCAYEWPGNVRELENAIERAIVLGTANRVVVDDLPQEVIAATATRTGPAAPYRSNVNETRRRLILEAIDRSGGNRTAAAKLLGINPTYLHRLLTNLGLRDAAGGP